MSWNAEKYGMVVLIQAITLTVSINTYEDPNNLEMIHQMISSLHCTFVVLLVAYFCLLIRDMRIFFLYIYIKKH